MNCWQIIGDNAVITIHVCIVGTKVGNDEIVMIDFVVIKNV